MLTETMKTGIQRIIMNSNRVIICSFTSWVPYFDICYGFRIKTMFGSTLPPIVCQGEGGQLYLHAYIGVQHILCCVLMFCFSSSCVPNVASFSGFSFFFLLSLRYSLTCIRHMSSPRHILQQYTIACLYNTQFTMEMIYRGAKTEMRMMVIKLFVDDVNISKKKTTKKRDILLTA